MSDYSWSRVIRLPLPATIGKTISTQSPECDVFLNKINANQGEGKKGKFVLEYTIDYESGKDYLFLDYVVDYSYGERTGDYGFSEYLSKDEIKKFRPLFEALDIDFEDSALRKVEYCYYNCCEPQTYYSVSDATKW